MSTKKQSSIASFFGAKSTLAASAEKRKEPSSSSADEENSSKKPRDADIADVSDAPRSKSMYSPVKARSATIATPSELKQTVLKDLDSEGEAELGGPAKEPLVTHKASIHDSELDDSEEQGIRLRSGNRPKPGSSKFVVDDEDDEEEESSESEAHSVDDDEDKPLSASIKKASPGVKSLSEKKAESSKLTAKSAKSPVKSSDTSLSPSVPSSSKALAVASIFSKKPVSKSAASSSKSASTSSSTPASSSSSSGAKAAEPATSFDTATVKEDTSSAVPLKSDDLTEEASSSKLPKKSFDSDDEEVDDELVSDDDDEIEDEDAPLKSSSKSTTEKKKSIGKLLSSSSSSAKYDPIVDAGWQGDKVPYLALTKMFEKVDMTSSRLAMIELCSNFLRSVIALSPQDLVPCIYLIVNKIAPAYEGLELGVGDAVLLKAISEATGRTLAHLKADLETSGDLGDIAMRSRSTQKVMFQPKPLQLREVYKKLRDIAMEHGSSAMKKKGDIIRVLLVSARESEAKFLIRSLQGKLRIGLAEQSVLVALARALTLTPPKLPGDASQVLDASASMSSSKLEAALEETTRIIKCVYTELPNYDVILPLALQHGVDSLMEKCHLTPGVPVKAMLAKPTKGISEVLSRFANRLFTLEYKYDGERAQIHVKENGEILIFSRNSENNTQKFPDLIARLPSAFKNVQSCIIDSEVVAYDRVQDKILPFQILSTRKRKAVSSEDIKVDICIYAFDLLYLNGKSLLREPFMARRQLLNDHFQEVKCEFLFAKHKDSSDPEDIQTFLNEAVQQSCEGLMVKTLEVEATYEPDRRSHNWLKVKKDYLDGVGDTLDLVPIGGYHGRGKRTGVYGAYLMACYDPDSEEYQSICKIGTGFSDEALESLASSLNEHKIDHAPKYYRYPENLECDVWFSPAQVWEVLAADLSISPAHKAALGKVDDSKGIALRFPRLIRKRDDKNPEDATSADQVADMYRSQANKQDDKAGFEDDY